MALTAAGLRVGDAVAAVLAERPGAAVSHADAARAFLSRVAPAARFAVVAVGPTPPAAAGSGAAVVAAAGPAGAA